MPSLNQKNIHQKAKITIRDLFKTIFYILPFLIVIPIIKILIVPPLILVPDSPLKFKPYCDNSENGNSEINYFRGDSSLVYAYTLREGFPYPYAGLAVCPDSGCFFDFHRFNRILVTFKTSSSNSIRLYIHTYQDSITRQGFALSERYNGVQIPASRNFQKNIFEFSELSTPEWWYETNRVVPRQLKSSDYSKVIAIDFNNGLTTELNSPDTLTISEMKIYRNNLPVFFWTAIPVILYYLILLLISHGNLKRANRKNRLEAIPYQKIELSCSSENELKKVVSFVGQNFTDPELSVNKVAISTGVSAYKVPSVVKDKFGCSFKEYLNKIRIEEAIRLLSTTDRQITEIAFAVGYNSPSHFTRLFKVITGKSPREFREKAK